MQMGFIPSFSRTNEEDLPNPCESQVTTADASHGVPLNERPPSSAASVCFGVFGCVPDFCFFCF